MLKDRFGKKSLILIKVIGITFLVLSTHLLVGTSQPELKSVAPAYPDWCKNATLVGEDFWWEIEEYEIREKVTNLASQNVKVVDIEIGFLDYEVLFNPQPLINTLADIVSIAHDTGLHSFVYVSGFELMTYDVENNVNSTSRDHPEWIQRDLDGNPAIFGEELGFWVEKGDESAWVTPLAPEWRTRYMSIISGIADTGIDGLYIDVPFWVVFYPNQDEPTWGSFDDYTVAEFISRYGHSPPSDESQFDLSDPVFIEWLQFRLDIVQEFFAEVSATAKAINPNIKIIMESWLPQGIHGLFSGTDPYYLYDHLDIVTYEFGINGHAEVYTQDLWLYQTVKDLLYRAIDHDHPSWMLDYGVWPDDSIMLAAEHVMFETNFWETKGPTMTATVGEDYRMELFGWIDQYDHYLYGNWETISPVAVYYSPQTRNFVYSLESYLNPIIDYGEGAYNDQFWGSYSEYIGGHHDYEVYGFAGMLLQSHIPTKIITSRDLSQLDDLGVEALILPDVAALNQTEIDAIEEFATKKPVIATADTSLYFHNGTMRDEYALTSLFGVSVNDDPSSIVRNGNCTYIKDRIGEEFMVDLIFARTSGAEQKRQNFLSDVLNPTGYVSPLSTSAPKSVLMNPYTNGLETIIRVVNFDGTREYHQTPNEQTFSISLIDPLDGKQKINSSITTKYGAIILADDTALSVLAEFMEGFSYTNWSTIGLIIGGVAFGVIIVVIVVSVVVLRRRKKGKR